MLQSFVCFALCTEHTGKHCADFVIHNVLCQAAYLQNEQAQRSAACRMIMQ